MMFCNHLCSKTAAVCEPSDIGPGYAVRHVHLTNQGLPQVLLSNRSAWLYHMGLKCWMCMADPAFSASPFTSFLALNNTLQGQPLCLYSLPCKCCYAVYAATCLVACLGLHGPCLTPCTLPILNPMAIRGYIQTASHTFNCSACLQQANFHK